MGNLFSQVLNMSMTGSAVILLVMLARLILKRSPKIFSYALWFVVLFRLLCPVAFTAPVSVLNALEPEIQEASGVTSVVYFLPAEANQNPDFTFVPAENQSGAELAQTGEPEHTGSDIMAIASYVWIAGTGIMILYSIVQYIRLRRKLVGAVAYTGNVYRADYIDTPFVMGIFCPKIYLPSNIPTQEQKYIIAHERHHIRRCDHIIKLLAYCALCIHWFNPLAWAAFILAGKDMEMSCDEAVIREMGPQIRADYSASLLRLATHKKMIAGMPLAFGEGNTKGRIMNMAKWKKPKLWVSMICVLLCAAVLVACAVNPQKSDTIDDTPTDGSAVITGVLLAFNLPSNLPIWIIILGALFAIGVGKMSFGGLGCNPFNPALAGRVFLLLSFPVQMTTWPVVGQLTSYMDATTGATPLALMKQAIHGDASALSQIPDALTLFIGQNGGCIGEVSALALLLGLVYMLWKKIITWHIPVSIIVTVFVFAGIMHMVDPEKYVSPVLQLFSGGLMLGAVFMATDYVTSPMSKKGMLIYGVCIGLLTVVIPLFGAYPEGMSFAILIMNAFTPLINTYCKPKRFGEVAKKK